MAKSKNIRVKYLKLGRNKVWGYATPSTNVVELDERLKGKKHLEILTHEVIHLLLPGASEEETERISIGLTKVLWSQGYRRVDDSDHLPLQDGSR